LHTAVYILDFVLIERMVVFSQVNNYEVFLQFEKQSLNTVHTSNCKRCNRTQRPLRSS